MTRRRGILSALLALCAVVLTACAGFPTSGPVHYGLDITAAGEESQSVAFLPNRPQPGATPAQIVEGFINAGTGPGVDGDWARAREFLAPQIRRSWNPEARVIVDLPGERAYAETGEGAVELSFDAVASVDDRGAYVRAELAEQTLPFRLAQQADGEWRITEAPDGIVLDRDQFPTVFHRYTVAYFDPSWQYIVPDVRWFPTSNAAARITDALVNQPRSEWLAPAVATAFGEGVTAVPAVTVSDGTAQVVLSEEALGADALTRDRMLTQLEASLGSAGVEDVEMSAGSTPLAADQVAVRSTRVPSAALVLTQEGEFGFLTEGEIDPIAGLSMQIVRAGPVAVQVGRERDAAAVRLPGGEVARVTAAGVEVLDDRPGLIDPTIDPYGIIWSVPAGEPTAVRATLPDGASVTVADAWAEATSVSAMTLSRDGTRVAAVVTTGGRTSLWIAGVARDPNGIPQRLGEPRILAPVGGVGVGVSWIDDVTIGVLAKGVDDAVVLEQVVGGPTSATTATGDMASIAGGTGGNTLRLRAADGTLFVKRGMTWQPTATGILVLATQQGAPR